MVIEVTTRYKIDKDDLDNIIDYYIEEKPALFLEWIIENISDFCFEDDEKLVSGDIETLYDLCQKAVKLENEKYNALGK